MRVVAVRIWVGAVRLVAEGKGKERKGKEGKGKRMRREGNEEERIGKAMRFGGAAHEQNTYSAKPFNYKYKTCAAGLPRQLLW